MALLPPIDGGFKLHFFNFFFSPFFYPHFALLTEFVFDFNLSLTRQDGRRDRSNTSRTQIGRTIRCPELRGFPKASENGAGAARVLGAHRKGEQDQRDHEKVQFSPLSHSKHNDDTCAGTLSFLSCDLRFLRRYDKDGDHKISRSELAVFMQGTSSKNPQYIYISCVYSIYRYI